MSQATKLLLISALFWFAQYVYQPNTAPYLLAQKVSADFVGIIVGVYGGVQMAARFPMGIFADILGRHKPIVMFGCLCSGSASIIRLLYSNGDGFFWANLLSGTASSMWLSFMLLYARGIAPERMQQALGYTFVASNIGILMSFCTSAFAYEFLGMDAMCLFSLICGFAALGIALTLKEAPDQQNTCNQASQVVNTITHSRPKLTELLAVLKIPQIWFFALMAAIQQGITMATVMSFSNEIAHNIGGSHLEVGMLTVVYIAFCVISSYLTSLNFFTRLNNGFLIGLSLFFLGVYCWGSVMTDNIYLLIALQVIMGCSYGFVFSLANAEALKGIPSWCRSSALGLFQAIFAFGMLWVPLIAGELFHRTGSLNSAFYFQAVLSFIGACCTLCYYLHRRIQKRKAVQQ